MFQDIFAILRTLEMKIPFMYGILHLTPVKFVSTYLLYT